MDDKSSLNLVVLQFQRDVRSEGDIWSKVKGLEEVDRDREATMMLIELYKKYQKQLSVKGARKKCIWETIAFELTNGGYPVDAEKCHQKWRNLEKICRKHMHFLKSSRASDPKRIRQPPEYFELLHPVLAGNKLSSSEELHRNISSVSEYIIVPAGEVVTDEEGVLTEDDQSSLLAAADETIDEGPEIKRIRSSALITTAGETVTNYVNETECSSNSDRDGGLIANILNLGQQLMQQQEQGFRHMTEQLDQHHQQSQRFLSTLVSLLQQNSVETPTTLTAEDEIVL